MTFLSFPIELHVALLGAELFTTDIGGMDLRERLLSSAVALLPSPVELVLSSLWGASQLNLGNSTRHPQQVQQLFQPLSSVQPCTRGTAHIWPGVWSQRMLRPLPSAASRSQLTGAWKEVCCSEPMQSSGLYKVPRRNSSSVAFDLAGSDGGKGKVLPLFFCFLNWGLPACHFHLCILSLQSINYDSTICKY